MKNNKWKEKKREIVYNRRVGKEEKVYLEPHKNFYERLKEYKLTEVIAILVSISAIISSYITYKISMENVAVLRESIEVSRENNMMQLRSMESLARERFAQELELARNEKYLEIKRDMRLNAQNSLTKMYSLVDHIISSHPSDAAIDTSYNFLKNQIFPNIEFYSGGVHDDIKSLQYHVFLYVKLRDLEVAIDSAKAQIYWLINKIRPNGDAYRVRYYASNFVEFRGKFVGYDLEPDSLLWDLEIKRCSRISYSMSSCLRN